MTANITLDSVFDERIQDEPWQIEVAQQLNSLLARAQYCRDTTNDESDQGFIVATLAVVARVANFEQIGLCEVTTTAKHFVRWDTNCGASLHILELPTDISDEAALQHAIDSLGGDNPVMSVKDWDDAVAHINAQRGDIV